MKIEMKKLKKKLKFNIKKLLYDLSEIVFLKKIKNENEKI